MKVELLYFDGCPHWTEAHARLREALLVIERAGVKIDHVLVSTLEEAQQRRFLGSPTILVNGDDPFAESGSSVALSCRLYPGANGPAGTPTVEELVDVLSRG